MVDEIIKSRKGRKRVDDMGMTQRGNYSHKTVKREEVLCPKCFQTKVFVKKDGYQCTKCKYKGKKNEFM